MNLRERGRQYEQMNRNNRNALFGQQNSGGSYGQGRYGQQGASNDYTQDMLTQQNDQMQEDLLMKAQQLRSIVTDDCSFFESIEKILNYIKIYLPIRLETKYGKM